MKQTSVNQKGFAVVESLLILVIGAIIGGTGYYIYQTYNKSTDTQNTAHQNAEAAIPNKKKEKVAQISQNPAPQRDEKGAIIAAVSEYVKKTIDNSSGMTFTYEVQEINGSNAKGAIRASAGDPLVFIAHKENGSWGVVYSSHLYPSKPDVCTKYGAPTSWCNGPSSL